MSKKAKIVANSKSIKSTKPAALNPASALSRMRSLADALQDLDVAEVDIQQAMDGIKDLVAFVFKGAQLAYKHDTENVVEQSRYLDSVYNVSGTHRTYDQAAAFLLDQLEECLHYENAEYARSQIVSVFKAIFSVPGTCEQVFETPSQFEGSTDCRFVIDAQAPNAVNRAAVLFQSAVLRKWASQVTAFMDRQLEPSKHPIYTQEGSASLGGGVFLLSATPSNSETTVYALCSEEEPEQEVLNGLKWARSPKDLV